MADSPIQIRTELSSVELPRYLYDGFVVHQEALGRGVNLFLLPRQVLLGSSQDPVPAEIAFTHGAPNSSTLSAMTFAQDRRLRRALLERAGVRRPKGASFSWRSLKKAQRWVEQQGYPVTVKETVDENHTNRTFTANDNSELTHAFSVLRERDAGDRAPGSNPLASGYSTTRLTFNVDENGNQVAPLRTRMLVEKWVPGTAYRVFVLDGRIIAAVELDESRTLGVRDASGDLTDTLRTAAIGAAEAIPGLACATVDLVAESRGRIRKRQLPSVIGLSERPRADTFIVPGANLPAQIASALVESEAARAQLKLSGATGERSRDLEIQGMRDAAGTAERLEEEFRRHGAQFQVLEIDDVNGNLTARASGRVQTITVLLELLMAGLLFDDRASAILSKKESDNV